MALLYGEKPVCDENLSISIFCKSNNNLSFINVHLFYVLASDPVTLNITGNVIASPCEVSAASANMTIGLGGGKDLQTADLNAAGSSSPWVPITVSLGNCPAGTSA
jgi:minor fimbrial subunit